MKLLWSGSLSQGGSVTIPELPYYNVFIAFIENNNRALIGALTSTDSIYFGGNTSDSGAVGSTSLVARVSGTKLTFVRARHCWVATNTYGVSVNVLFTSLYGVL